MGKAIATLVLTVGWTSFAGAGDPVADPLAAGVRVRLTAPAVSRSKPVGWIDSVSADGMSLRVDGRPAAIVVSRSVLTKLEVSEGKRSVGKRALRGLGIGAAAEAIVGTMQIPFTCPHNGGSHCDDDIPDWFYPASSAVLGAALGALIGAVSGSPERWKEVPVNHPQVSVAPTRGGGVAVRVAISR